MNEWQPIETAPKDGTAILGFGKCEGEIHGPLFDEPICAVIYWGYDWSVLATDAYAVKMEPTYWMPLPELPESGA